ncbi:hypothetical protein LTR08_006238 [Meristemomyces frigidus]|nr:hypothetical protein LTR08_006238 [Meristemomyces frigidus]
MSALQPPRIITQDPGAHDLDESDDHFSSASEGGDPATPPRPAAADPAPPASPIPVTRVERVDDQPAHGEVPGTPAYALRTQDAVPDELEIVPEGQRSRSATLQQEGRARASSHLSSASRESRPQTPVSPGGTRIPKVVVERVDDAPAHGEVEGTLAREMRMADAEPDEVRRAPEEARSGVIDGRGDDQPVDEEARQVWFRSMWEGGSGGQGGEGARGEVQAEEVVLSAQPEDSVVQPEDPVVQPEEEGFGDDFNDFNEGGGGDDDDDDFGDFDEAEEEEHGLEAAPSEEQPQPQPEARQPAVPDILGGLPPLNLSTLSTPATNAAITPYISALFPDHPTPTQPTRDTPPPDEDTCNPTPFLSTRSLSLWQQLVSPPPLQPPDWTRSRIRRLFLVSLGVPVDLDEILPPSKQKRLVLPNITLASAPPSPRPSVALNRLKTGHATNNNKGPNTSTTSLDTPTGLPKPNPSSSRRLPKGPPPPPDLDLNTTTLLCRTTPEALAGLSPTELSQHVQRLAELRLRASGVLEYWLGRREDGVREKEVLEGVVGNLVGFVKGRRGG